MSEKNSANKDASKLTLRTPLTLAIRAQMNRHGYDQTKLAEELKVTTTRVSEWLKTGKVPPFQVAELIQLFGYLPVFDELLRMIETDQEMHEGFRAGRAPIYLEDDDIVRMLFNLYNRGSNQEWFESMQLNTHALEPIRLDARCAYDALRINAVGARIAANNEAFRHRFAWSAPKPISEKDLEKADATGSFLKRS